MTGEELKGTSGALGDLGCSSQQKVVSVRRRWGTQTSSAAAGTTNAASLPSSNLNEHKAALWEERGRSWKSGRPERVEASWENTMERARQCLSFLFLWCLTVFGKQLRGALMLLSLRLDGSRSSAFSLYLQKHSFWIELPPNVSFLVQHLAPFPTWPELWCSNVWLQVPVFLKTWGSVRWRKWGWFYCQDNLLFLPFVGKLEDI